MKEQESSCCVVVPPGFRFHPTEEELVGYYLARKVSSQETDHIIQEVDLYRIEPWDLLRLQRSATGEESKEWYFFSYKDRKYPSGTRTNRATAAGFWKATGRDKPVMSSRLRGSNCRVVIGMRKTLVFYQGRAPNGRKTDWIMHEYRLQSDEHAPPQEEGWVVCRAFQKPVPNQRPSSFSSSSSLMAYRYPISPTYVVDGHFLPPLSYAADDFESKTKQHLFPQLIDNGYQQENLLGEELTMIQHGGGVGVGGPQAAAGNIDWNFLDTLLSSTIHDPSSS